MRIKNVGVRFITPVMKGAINCAPTILMICCLCASAAETESERDEARKQVEDRNVNQVMAYFLGSPQDGKNLNTSVAIDLYNQAVEFYNKKEYDLASQMLQDSLRYDDKNPFAHELLGDIAYFQQKMTGALKHYQDAYRLKARADLKEKITKVQNEKKVESGLKTYGGEHFIIKYKGEERGLEGFELRELLRNAYRDVGQHFGYFFKHKVVVLLYDEEEYRQLAGVPHWSSGVFDGKIRLPAYQKGFTKKEIEKIMRHELTHAFVVDLSQGKCPTWLNEGLAEFEEAKVQVPDDTVFRAAVRSNTLFPLDKLFSESKLLQMTDPLEVSLFYQQSYQVVKYLVERYGMYNAKRMLLLYAEGKDTLTIMQRLYGLSPLGFEKRWRETLS